MLFECQPRNIRSSIAKLSDLLSFASPRIRRTWIEKKRLIGVYDANFQKGCLQAVASPKQQSGLILSKSCRRIPPAYGEPLASSEPLANILRISISKFMLFNQGAPRRRGRAIIPGRPTIGVGE